MSNLDILAEKISEMEERIGFLGREIKKLKRRVRFFQTSAYDRVVYRDLIDLISQYESEILSLEEQVHNMRYSFLRTGEFVPA